MSPTKNGSIGRTTPGYNFKISVTFSEVVQSSFKVERTDKSILLALFFLGSVSAFTNAEISALPTNLE